MFTPYRLIFFFFILAFASHSWGAKDFETLQSFADSKVWHSLYQYQKKWNGRFESQITVPQFFFSSNGMQNPLQELQAAIAAYQSNQGQYGIENLSPACAYPARKRILEKYLQLQFPKVKCVGVEDWLDRLQADHASIHFAGAYSGNPASILGHTFLRLYNENSKREGRELLSYAVGFLAISPPDDSRAIYMVKGLTGQYPGHYEIEPFYMKVGIYNNSESRDIWEQKLNLTKEEVELLQLLIWEYTFNAQIPYYFVDENCSYRLLSLLEVIRPELDLVDSLRWVVLPPDTVRVLMSAGLVDPTPYFRASILRRLNEKKSRLTDQEQAEFSLAQKNADFTRTVKSISVLDTLIDYWTYTNYRALTKLSPADSEIMEVTFSRRAELQGASTVLSDDFIKTKYELMPPYQGHKTSRVSLYVGEYDKQTQGLLSYRMGAHAMTDSQWGYENITALEYLGFDIASRQHGSRRYVDWEAYFVDTKSLEPLNVTEKKPSWSAKISLSSFADQRDLQIKGGFGGAYDWSQMRFYFLPEASVEIQSSEYASLFAGYELGVVTHWGEHSLHLFHEKLWKERGEKNQEELMWSYHLRDDHSLNARFISSYQGAQTQWLFGSLWHF